jgi:hypothetical protein
MATDNTFLNDISGTGIFESDLSGGIPTFYNSVMDNINIDDMSGVAMTFGKVANFNAAGCLEVSTALLTLPTSYTNVIQTSSSGTEPLTVADAASYSKDLTAFIMSETTRIEKIKSLYEAYDSLNAVITSPDGALTDVQKQIYHTHLNDDIEILKSKNNLAIANAILKMTTVACDLNVANTVMQSTRVKQSTGTDLPSMPGYQKNSSVAVL